MEPKKGDFSISGKSEAMIGLHDSLLKANGESFKLSEFNYDTVLLNLLLVRGVKMIVKSLSYKSPQLTVCVETKRTKMYSFKSSSFHKLMLI